MNSYPSEENLSDHQSFPELKDGPTWFLRFLALFNCDSIPKILFARAAQPSTRWNNAGELVCVDLSCLHLVHPRFEEVVGQLSWSERFTNIDNRKMDIESLMESEDAGEDECQSITAESQLIILMIVASAFPDPWCEVVWEDVEEELWEVVESTCLPLLGVLDRDDLENFLEDYLIHRKSDFLFMLLKFLIRIAVIVGNRAPPNLFELVSQSIHLFREYGEASNGASQEDLEYILLSRSIAEILMDTNQLPLAAERLHSLSHNDSMRANAAIGFALAYLPPDQMPSASKKSLMWTPVLPDTPSTMEVLVQSQLFGAAMLAKLSGIRWESLSLTTRVLVGFSEARKRAFFNAAEILEQLIGDVETTYGSASLELLLIGTTLVNCCNATERERDGERIGRYIWSNMFGSFKPNSSVGPAQQTYLMVAISDSFLGQRKYSVAKELLIRVLDYKIINNDLAISATLRLLKMSRRERDPSSLFEDWERLGHGMKLFDKVSDTLKYECVEETVCLLSTLEPDHITKIPALMQIVKTLMNYRISTYKGSLASKSNLYRNLEELKCFKSKLNLFSTSGPELSYCRKLRERFLPASVQIIEKVGSTNWQRFKRVKEMREMLIKVDPAPRTIAPGPQIIASSKSAFHDSGLGSSLGSSLGLDLASISSSKVARSTTSIRSYMSTKEDATLLPPLPPMTSTGERICFICEKPIPDVRNESQWSRHAFSDLRPYVCVVDDCDADHMSFTSRAEFAAHMMEHQQIIQWTCAICGHSEEKKELIQDHVNFKHITNSSQHRNFNIIQKAVHRDLSIQSCPFCGEVPGAASFVGHLCHHLEEISLSAIPQDPELYEDNEEKSSSGLTDSEAATIPIYGMPLARAKNGHTAASSYLSLSRSIGSLEAVDGYDDMELDHDHILGQQLEQPSLADASRSSSPIYTSESLRQGENREGSRENSGFPDMLQWPAAKPDTGDAAMSDEGGEERQWDSLPLFPLHTLVTTPHPYLWDEYKEDILELYEEGLSIPVIHKRIRSDVFKISERALYDNIKEWGLPTDPSTRRRRAARMKAMDMKAGTTLVNRELKPSD